MDSEKLTNVANNIKTRGQPQTMNPVIAFLSLQSNQKQISSRRGRKMAILAPSMATQKPLTKTFGYTKAATMRGASKRSTTTSNIKLLTNVEKLRLLTKAEKAGLLSAAEKAGFSLSSIEKLGLLSKAEELGVLSAATDPSTPSALLTLSLTLLGLGPLLVYLVPEEYPWEIGVQVVVALVCVGGGSAAFDFVSNLQKSS